jgi:hypothetical protein
MREEGADKNLKTAVTRNAAGSEAGAFKSGTLKTDLQPLTSDL